MRDATGFRHKPSAMRIKRVRVRALLAHAQCLQCITHAVVAIETDAVRAEEDGRNNGMMPTTVLGVLSRKEEEYDSCYQDYHHQSGEQPMDTYLCLLMLLVSNAGKPSSIPYPILDFHSIFVFTCPSLNAIL